MDKGEEITCTGRLYLRHMIKFFMNRGYTPLYVIQMVLTFLHQMILRIEYILAKEITGRSKRIKNIKAYMLMLQNTMICIEKRNGLGFGWSLGILCKFCKKELCYYEK
jgi:hypothetical protein